MLNLYMIHIYSTLKFILECINKRIPIYYTDYRRQGSVRNKYIGSILNAVRNQPTDTRIRLDISTAVIYINGSRHLAVQVSVPRTKIIRINICICIDR